MIQIILCSAALVSISLAQSCSSTAAQNGPCINGLCATGSTCIVSTQMCCNNANVIPATTCVDKVNPSTGISDCTRLASYCNLSTYYTLMTTQCPRTCGRCSTITTTIASTCVDRTNPSTGVSDCASRASLCNNATYFTLMTQQCPRTCGRCSG